MTPAACVSILALPVVYLLDENPPGCQRYQRQYKTLLADIALVHRAREIAQNWTAGATVWQSLVME